MLLKQTLAVFYLFLCVGVFSTKVNAQASADSAGSSINAYHHIIDKYYTAIGPQSRLYNGLEYVPNYVAIKGNPYFNNAADWGIGNVNYDGYLYKNVKIRYDLYKDLVVIPLYNSVIRISLLNNKMQSFDVYGHHFVYIKNDPAITGSLATGFYDELYGGKIQVLSKRSESLQQDHALETITSYFLPSTNYYFFKNNQYFTVNSKGEFLDAMKDKKKEVQQFIRDNKIKFKKDSKEQDMAHVAEYYDHLSE